MKCSRPQGLDRDRGQGTGTRKPGGNGSSGSSGRVVKEAEDTDVSYFPVCGKPVGAQTSYFAVFGGAGVGTMCSYH